MTERMEIIGALAYMPNRARRLQDGRIGDVGLIDVLIKEKKLQFADILDWVSDIYIYIYIGLEYFDKHIIFNLS